MYEFSYKTEAADLWQMSLYYTYSNLIGAINVIFTVAMIGLTVGTWNNTGIILRVVLILASCWFVVFQPLIMWQKAKKRAEQISFTTELTFSEQGMMVQVENQSQSIPWSKITKTVKLPTMIIIYSDAVHGYVLNNRTLGNKRNAFAEFVNQKMSDNK